MNINRYMQKGIATIIATAGRYYAGSRKGRAFLGRLGPAMLEARSRRARHELEGLQVPPFLIASIASQCNLRCAGCYARAGGGCGDAPSGDLCAGKWAGIFDEASDLGVSFILLAGGEPLLRRDVLEAAAGYENMVFPVFTNGTVIGDDYLEFFDRHRNMLPVLSIEGDAMETDRRRGQGTYGKIAAAMAGLRQRGILYGVSVTVTKENLATVTDSGFVSGLREKGCGLAFFVEYVPAESGTEHLVLTQEEIDSLMERTASLKKQFRDMIVIAFPGDEEAMGGCLAAGRGFFHINSAGGAEPCPFSPYSRYNVTERPMADILRSRFFGDLREIAAGAEHSGGCTLFRHREQVEALLA